jgi:hypothetical protein
MYFVDKETTDGTDRLGKAKYVVDYPHQKFLSLYKI